MSVCRLGRLPRVEELVVATVALGFTAYTEWALISDRLSVQTDARLHEFWMRRFRDGALFQDPLTDALLETGYSPLAWQGVYRLASYVVDPVRFGELLPLVLVPFSVWLVFRITREISDWPPAAWLASALFLLPWDLHRFSGGHARAFAHPTTLLVVYLLVRGRSRAAALVPPFGLLFYPPAGLVALGAVVACSLRWEGRPRLVPRRALAAGVSVGLAALAVLLPRLVTGDSPDLLSESEARLYPEFGESGQMHFFVSSALEFLQQNYSGFDLRESGSMLVVATLALLLVRWRNALLVPWPVWTLPITGLALFATAHLVLFRLYLPHRYTYPLIPFCAVFIAAAWHPTWESLARRVHPSIRGIVLLPGFVGAVALLALAAFPLGPRLDAAGTRAWFSDAWPYLGGAILAGLALAVLVDGLGGRRWRVSMAGTVIATGVLLATTVGVAGVQTSPVVKCKNAALLEYLASVPKDSVIAGNPLRLDCVPIVSERAVVINHKLYQPWERDYFRIIRERMFAMVDAYYGSSQAEIVALRDRYGADFLVVEDRVTAGPWRETAPFTWRVRRLTAGSEEPAVHRLPPDCLSWEGGSLSVYGLQCVADEPVSTSAGIRADS